MNLLLLLTSLLTGCLPTVAQPQAQLKAVARVEGNVLYLTVTNVGPHELLLDNGCPRPFGVGFTKPVLRVQNSTEASGLHLVQSCLTILLPPEPWPVGTSKTAVIDLPPSQRTWTLNVWAEAEVKLAPGGIPQGAFQTIRVNAPTLTLERP